MILRPPGSKGTDTHVPNTTLFRSEDRELGQSEPPVGRTGASLETIVATVVVVTSVVLTVPSSSLPPSPSVPPSSPPVPGSVGPSVPRSAEHTSELQSLMRTSYAVVCLKKHTITT